jgi:glyoxylase-like metal-dependent hydrolase (beta-lactamase superfamily II)
VLFGDVGRDDLPGGNPEAHYESLLLLKKFAKDEMILLPGHDHKGGRISTWQEQMKINSSLTQERESFIKEAAAFDAPAPALLKKSLRENFK